VSTISVDSSSSQASIENTSADLTMIIGIVIACVLILVVICLIVCLVVIRKKTEAAELSAKLHPNLKQMQAV